MKLKSIFLSTIITLFTTGCVIEYGDSDLSNNRTQSGYLIYNNFNTTILNSLSNLSFLLSLDYYLKCDDSDLRNSIYNSYLFGYDIINKGAGTYEIRKKDILYYTLETGDRSLSEDESTWSLKGKLDRTYENYKVTCIGNNQWDVSANSFGLNDFPEQPSSMFQLSVSSTFEEITSKALLRELEISGKGTIRNSMFTACIIESPLIIRESCISSGFGGNKLHKNIIADGDIKFYAQFIDDKNVYPIFADISENKETNDFKVAITFNGFTETWRNFEVEKY